MLLCVDVKLFRYVKAYESRFMRTYGLKTKKDQQALKIKIKYSTLSKHHLRVRYR